MNSLFKPRNSLKRAFVNLESDMDDLIKDEFHAPPPEPAEAQPGVDATTDGGRPQVSEVPETDPFEDILAEIQRSNNDGAAEAAHAGASQAAAGQPQGSERFTAHTRNRLAGFASFEEARAASDLNLARISEALSSVVAAHSLGQEFLADCQSEIYRANDLELQNAALTSENRRLGDRADRLEKQCLRFETLVEMQKRRETKASQELATLREALDAARMETVEARSVIARVESENGELQTTVAAKSSLAERLLRENEMLREKGATLALDLENAVKKQAEFRRKHEDLTALRSTESVEHAETTARLSSAESEMARLQKLNDTLEARATEAEDALRAAEQEMNERERRHQSELHTLRAERQNLGARLQASTTQHLDAMSEVAALKTRISNLESEKSLAEKKYAALWADVESQEFRRDKSDNASAKSAEAGRAEKKADASDDKGSARRNGSGPAPKPAA